MGRNLSNLPISASFQYLLQASGSEVNDGLGNDVDYLNVSASYALSASNATTATSASYATTASFALNVPTVETGSLMETGSVVDATLTFTKADATTFDLTVDNVASATSASHALIADDALTATSASYATTASLALALEGGVSLQSVLDTGNTATEDIILTGDITSTGIEATGVIKKTVAGTTTFQVTSGDATNATVTLGNGVGYGKIDFDGNGANRIEANTQLSIDTPDLTLTGDVEGSSTNMNINSITASFASFTSASIGYLQTITGSAKIIGDAYIILNNDTPTERYAGLVVQDSGSTANTASLEFDGQTNDWFYEYTDDGGVTVDHGVAMFGPEYNTKGSPVYPTNNRLLKGDGGHHVEDSSITDDGSKVTSTVPLADMVLSGSTVITGSVDILLPTDASDVNIKNPDEKLALIVRGGIMAGSDQDLSTDDGYNNHIFGERITAQGSTQTCGALGSRQVDFGGNGIEYSAFIATQDSDFDGMNKSAIIGGSSHAMDTEDSLGEENVILGGQSHRIGAGERNAIVAGESNTIVEGNSRAIIAGKNHTLGYDSGVAEYSGSVIIGGEGHLSKHNNTVILGGMDITSSADNTVYVPNLTLTGSGATLTFDDGTTMTTAASGGGAAFPFTGSAEISGSLRVTKGPFITGHPDNSASGGVGCVVLGGGLNGGGDANEAIGFENAIIGGHNNVSNGDQAGVAFGKDNTVGATQACSVGGRSHNVTGVYGGTFAGNGNTVSHARSVVIGGGALSTTKADEVVVPSLTVKGNVVQDVNSITITSNTGSIDASLGSLFEITLQNATGTMLEIENQVAGQTFQLKITNNATAAGTIEFDSQFEFEGGTAFEATAAVNAVDILTLTTFDGSSVQCVGAKNFS